MQLVASTPSDGRAQGGGLQEPSAASEVRRMSNRLRTQGRIVRLGDLQCCVYAGRSAVQTQLAASAPSDRRAQGPRLQEPWPATRIAGWRSDPQATEAVRIRCNRQRVTKERVDMRTDVRMFTATPSYCKAAW